MRRIGGWNKWDATELHRIVGIDVMTEMDGMCGMGEMGGMNGDGRMQHA